VSWHKCACCGSLDYRNTGIMDADPGPDFRCGPCEKRGGMCLHNVSQREDKRAHYSVPHLSPGGPPETCQWCLGRARIYDVMKDWYA
jgi:hypothetical protein